VASLDVINGTLVMETLQRIARTVGLTVIASLHHVEYARRYAGRVLGLRGGRLVFDGSPARLTESVLVDIFGDISIQVPGLSPTGVGEEVWVLS
jgi:phosphonate transport system ATP-binding protein